MKFKNAALLIFAVSLLAGTGRIAMSAEINALSFNGQPWANDSAGGKGVIPRFYDMIAAKAVSI